ncbi:hypothetical protein I302_109139 [Kwoniella bestiolae CBS 10118]|uniref:Uncharacterized protein n=1 Tax=Kwoniella bestiolae CBS 10118 TaxID=1296100 RepID=A0A1B9FV46_9TREE|nr:hypothetical protein I302_08285 [Kwoniella bestiolae CBS 10118]OCF22634.1 hypothetical protein I302_08285 [Kwoniella bestiolae CBS 10118]
MAPSMFARPSQPPHDARQATLSHRQKLKSISSFFPSFNHPSSTQIDEPHVIPYRQPEIPSQQTGYEGLPSIKNGSNISLPLRSNYTVSPSQSLPSLKVTLQRQISSGTGDGVTYTSHNLQQQLSKEMPTLASAIHIPDSSISTSSRNTTVVRQQTQNGIHPLYHLNASSTSLLGSYVQVNEILHVVNVDIAPDQNQNGLIETVGKRERSNSRSTITQTTKRLTRRLSLDNIVPKITSMGSLRKRERSSSKSSILDNHGTATGGEGRRWSLFSSQNGNHAVQNEPEHAQQPTQAIKPLMKQGMPVSRNWRNKFTVKPSSTAHRSGGKGNVPTDAGGRLDAARQARERSRAESAEYRERYDERTIKRVPVRGMREMSFGGGKEDKVRERQSMISMLDAGNTLRERDGCNAAATLSFVHRPSSRASSFDPAATPKSTSSSVPIPFVPTGPPPGALPESQTTISLAATFDSPSPLPRPVHTPLNRSVGLRIPSATIGQRAEMFSPAQDDRSILDPARSPCPIPDVSPLVPMSSGLQYQNMPLPPPPVQHPQTTCPPINKSVKVESINQGEHGGGQKEALDMSSLDKSLAEIAAEMPTLAAQPSQTGTFGVSDSDSAQTWHTATSPPPLKNSSSTRTMYTLPRSKSKSHTDLSSYTSTKNLVEHIEATQGPGWWSTDKRVNRRVSTMTLRDNREEEAELNRLERLAQSTTLPHRAKFDEQDQNETVTSPTSGRMRIGMAEEDKLRTRSSLDLRSSYRSSGAGDTIRSGQGQGHHPRPSLMAGSIWSKDVPPSPRRSVLSRHIAGDTQTPIKTQPASIPFPLSEVRNGTFVSNRISPDIARRASFLSKENTSNSSENDSSASPSRSTSRQTTRTTLSTSTAPTSVQSDSDHEEASTMIGKVEKMKMEYETKIINLKERHILEIDAVLSALSTTKNENAVLKEENRRLQKMIVDGQKEREGMKEKIRILCISLQTIELGSITSSHPATSLGQDQEEVVSQMKRSESVVSSLLPELINPNPISPLPFSSSRNIDEFGRKQDQDQPLTSDSLGREEMRNKGIMDALSLSICRRTSSSSSPRGRGGNRKVSASSVRTLESNILDEGNESYEEKDQEGWTLRLRDADVRFLDDL